MSIEPAVRRLLQEQLSTPGPDSHADVPERRAELGRRHGTFVDGLPDYPRYPDVTVADLVVEIEGREIPVRAFVPEGSGPFPVYLFFFGGAWWQRTFDSADILDACTQAAHDGGVVVLEVDYRLAPEHPFPAALADGAAVLDWVTTASDLLPIDPRRIAVGGQSSGGNLAAALCLWTRDHDGPTIGLQILEVPALDLSRLFEPSTALASNLDDDAKAAMAEVARFYLEADTEATSPYASPLLADSLGGLPPALVLTAEFDPLRAEAEEYATRLMQSEVPTVCVRYAGQVHFAPLLGSLTPSGRAWRSQVGQALRDFATAV